MCQSGFCIHRQSGKLCQKNDGNRTAPRYSRIQLLQWIPYKILTFYPYLESRTETLYDLNGQTIMSSITESFTYNDNLLPVKTVKNLSDGSIMTQTITYPDDYSSDILSRMSDRGMVSSQVETLTCIDGKVTEGKLVEYALDYRVYRNGKWDYVRTSFQGISYTINEGYCPIDNVRVWLEDADIETYSWYPLTGLRSRTDGAARPRERIR